MEVHIRELPEGVIEVYQARAKSRGHSLEAELRDVLVRGVVRTDTNRLTRVRALRARSPVQTSDSADLLREDRDR